MWQWTAYAMWHTCNKHLNDAHSLILFFLSFFFFFFLTLLPIYFYLFTKLSLLFFFPLLSSKNLVMTNGKISDGKMLNATKRKDINSKDKNKFFFWQIGQQSMSQGHWALPPLHTHSTQLWSVIAGKQACWPQVTTEYMGDGYQ